VVLDRCIAVFGTVHLASISQVYHSRQ